MAVAVTGDGGPEWRPGPGMGMGTELWPSSGGRFKLLLLRSVVSFLALEFKPRLFSRLGHGIESGIPRSEIRRVDEADWAD